MMLIAQDDHQSVSVEPDNFRGAAAVSCERSHITVDFDLAPLFQFC